MTAQKTQIGAKDPAHATSFQPTSGIAATDVQEAIEAVDSSAAADLAAHVADADPHPQYLQQHMLPSSAGFARKAELRARTAQVTADDARQMAVNATGLAQRADLRIRKLDDVQIALRAQVFN